MNDKLTPFALSKDEFIVSRIYRMPIYRTFSYIEKYIVSNLPYRVSRYFQNQWFFVFFCRKFQKFSENSPKIQKTHEPKSSTTTTAPKIPKIRRKFWKFAENSSKRRSSLRPSYRIVSYREKNPHIVSISYRVEKKLIALHWCRWTFLIFVKIFVFTFFCAMLSHVKWQQWKLLILCSKGCPTAQLCNHYIIRQLALWKGYHLMVSISTYPCTGGTTWSWDDWSKLWILYIKTY